MTPDDFSVAFPSESDYVEFKQGVPEKVAEAVTSFSNTDGGVVLLGVDNSGRVVGITTDGEQQAKVHRIIARVHSPGRYEVRELLVGDRSILVLSINRRREGLAQMNDGRVLVRRGAMNTALIGDELMRFVAARSLTRYESTSVPVALRDADPALVQRLREAHGWSADTTAERLVEAGFAVRADGNVSLTVAGALYLLPRPAAVLGKAFVEVFRYRDDPDVYDRRVEIDGPVNDQVEEATKIIVDELGSDVVVIGLHRHELPRVPEPVLREAVANAVAHRTYENTRQPIRIELRPDRVVVTSPGGLPEPVTLANLREQNAARNITVIKALRRFRLAEDAGLGIDVMQDTMEEALLEPPEFEADQKHVSVVLRLGSTVTPQERAWIAEVERRGEIRAQDKYLLLHAARGELLTNGSVREFLGVDSVHARAALQRLRDLGYLRQSGERGGSSYTLAKELGPPAGLQLAEDELRRLVLALAEEGRITNEQVRVATGLDRVQVLALLSRMVEAGEIQRHGERRGTHYTAASGA
jgi:ATP-dependent DNA helicase RecG